MDPYAEVISTAIENEDMSLLPELWNLTLLAEARGDGVIWRKRMTEKIPNIARRYGMLPNASFPVFANHWRAEQLVREKRGNVAAAIEELIARGAEDQVIYLSKLRPHFNWEKLTTLAVKHGQNNLARFFFNKFVRENKDEEWEITFTAKDLFEIALERGNSELMLYFLHLSKYSEDNLVKAFLYARKDEWFMRTLLYEPINSLELGYAAGNLVDEGDIELAERLLAEGASKGAFLRTIVAKDNKPLIKKYLQDFDTLRSGNGGHLYQNILDRGDYEMIDFIAKKRPEMIAGLLTLAKDENKDEAMIAYLEQLL